MLLRAVKNHVVFVFRRLLLLCQTNKQRDISLGSWSRKFVTIRNPRLVSDSAEIFFLFLVPKMENYKPLSYEEESQLPEKRIIDHVKPTRVASLDVFRGLCVFVSSIFLKSEQKSLEFCIKFGF